MKGTFLLIFKKKKLLKKLTELFSKEAKKFNGLYNGIERICNGQNKNNFKALDEFYQRVSYLSGYEELIKLMGALLPTSSQSEKNLRKLSKIIINAAIASGISHKQADEVITLTRENVLHYQDWNGGEIYEDDKVKIISPAWYQEGKLLEHGFCTLEQEAEN